MAWPYHLDLYYFDKWQSPLCRSFPEYRRDSWVTLKPKVTFFTSSRPRPSPETAHTRLRQISDQGSLGDPPMPALYGGSFTVIERRPEMMALSASP